MSTMIALGDLKFGGVRVVVPATAEITPNFRNGSNNALLQDALDEMYSDYEDGEYDPFLRNEGLVFVLELEPDEKKLRTNVVTIRANERRHWGVHSGHTARRPDLSPFVKRGDEWPEADHITIELAGSPDLPSLVRAYPGTYRPPLPWMSSAKYADGGIKASCKYWETHAYVYANNLIRDRVTSQAPLWFTDYESYTRRRSSRTVGRSRPSRRR